jgi:hypothetical protein
MVRSATIDRSLLLVILIENVASARPATSSATRMVVREVGGSVRSWTMTPPPFSIRNEILTGTATGLGFASSRSVSKKLPVAPSDRK